MIVVDASVLVAALTDDGPVGAASRSELARDDHWLAPEHMVVETYSGVRGRYLGRKITERRASEAVEALAVVAIDVVGTAALLPRMWQLRDRVTGYDAAYVAAAEMAVCPLVTADVRLSRVSGVECDVRVVAPAV